MNAVDESIVALALRTAHGLDCVNGSTRALGRIVGRYVGCRLGARIMGMSTTLEYDEIPDIAEDVRRIVAWAFDHPEAASDLLTILEASERAHPESVEMRVRSLCSAIRHDPETVTKVAEELKCRKRRGSG